MEKKPKNRGKYLVIAVIIIAFVAVYYSAAQAGKKIDYNVDTAKFIHEDLQLVMDRIENAEEGIYYFGFPTCPWCMELVPILDEVLAQTNQQAYVINTRGEGYSDIRSRAEQFYSNYYEGNFLTPFLVVIKADGSLQTHVGTLEDHFASTEKLTEEQKVELISLLLDLIE